MYGSRGPRPWTLIAIGVSLLLHGLALFVLPRLPRPAKRHRPPLIISLVKPPEPEKSAPPVAPQAPRIPAEDPVTEPREQPPEPLPKTRPQRVPGSASQEGEKPPTRRETAPNEGPTAGTLELFPDAAIREGAKKVHGGNPVQEMLEGVRFGRVHGPRKLPSARALGDRFLGHFVPPADVVRYSGKLERRGFARELKRYVTSAPRDDLAINEDLLDPFVNTPFDGGKVAWFCIAGCSSSHVVSKLSVLVEVRHANGHPDKRGVVLVSSGYAAFDFAALDAVQTTVELAARDSTRFPPETRVTHWLFEAEVFRYRRDELLLDPQFEPPGRIVDESFGAVYSMKTYVRFTAINDGRVDLDP